MNRKTPEIGRDQFVMICSYCEKPLSGSDDHESDENSFGRKHISHGICPDCLLEHFPAEYIKIQEQYRLRIKHSYRTSLMAAQQNICK